MSDNNYQEVIKNNKLFEGIPSQNLKISFQNEQLLRLKEGEIIFQKGDESKFTYLILAGKVKIKVYFENKSVKLNKTEKDFFGEIEVLEDTYRRSAAVANTDCMLYYLSKSDLRTFLAEIPEINDNIIAYNKVDIPDLKIVIHPDLLKKDTDKLYIIPEQTNNLETESADKDEEVKDEPLAVVNENIIELDEALKKEITEQATEVNENSLLVNAPDILTNSESKSELIETEKNPVDLFVEENNERISDKITPPVEPLKNNFKAETRSIEEKLPEEKAKIEEPTVENVIVNQVKPVSEKIEESREAQKNITAAPAEIASEKTQEGKGNKEEPAWINLTRTESKEEIAPEISETEREKIEAEEEKIKYDDTELNTGKILEAISRINSGLNDRVVHSNIIREAVIITEAQAGLLYLIDNQKNLLVTEMETEDGVVEISYPSGNGLTGLAAETGEIINVRDPVKDFRFSEDVDSIRGIVGSSLLCVPVLNEERETIAVICLANSGSGKFLISDEENMASLVPHISQTLQNLANVRKMVEQNKNIHLSTLTKFITENIQTPVLTMKYYAAQIKKKNLTTDVKTVLNVLMDQADSVVNFLYSSLAFTENRNSLQIEEYDLKDVIDNTLALLAEYVESRNVALYKKVEGEVRVKVDKKAFYQACLQIAKNACDAMGESGKIYITAKRSGDLINIEFRDTGPGIPDEIKSQIFQPFKSFNKENGTGLGLALSQKIIRDHGGELTVESKPGEGATFIISLPSFN